VPLSATAHEQGGVYARENLIQWKRHGNLIAFHTRRKDVGSGLADIAKGNFHDTVGKLRENLVESHIDGQIANGLHANFCAQFAGQPIENGLERNGDTGNASGRAISV